MSTNRPTPAPESSVFYHAEGMTLCTGDTLTILRQLPANSVNCVVTSPPPWKLPDDTTTDWSSGQTERQHLAGYIAALQRVFVQVRHVLAPTGTVWINLGDRYTRNSTLLGIPWRVALALQADGWILRNAIICHHPNTPRRDRLTCQYQLLFLLVRQPHYFFNLDPIRQHYTGDRPLSRRAHHCGSKRHTATGTWPPPGVTETHLHGRNPGDVWTIPTEADATGHPTSPPLELPTRCIAAGCPPGGTVLDPFSGTATTGLAARQLGRTYIGIDTNPNHHTTALHHLGLTPSRDDPLTRSEAA